MSYGSDPALFAEREELEEIRALGAEQKRKAGWSEEAIQVLMAHTKVEMTEGYLKKDEAPWTDVRAP